MRVEGGVVVVILSPGDTYNVWRHFWLPQQEERCYWHTAGRGQGAANCNSTTKNSLAPNGNGSQVGKVSKKVFSLQCLTFGAGKFSEFGCSLAAAHKNSWPAECWKTKRLFCFSLEADVFSLKWRVNLWWGEGQLWVPSGHRQRNLAGRLHLAWLSTLSHSRPACLPPLPGRKCGNRFKKC